MRDSTLPSSVLSPHEAAPRAAAASAKVRGDQTFENSRLVKHGQDLLAAQAVLLPLVLLASAAGSAALILNGPFVAWPHPLIVAQMALAGAQLGALSLFAALAPRTRILSVTAMVALTLVWSKCLSHVELSFAQWSVLLMSLSLPLIGALALLRWRGLRLFVRKQQALTARQTNLDEAQELPDSNERSPWQFSLGSLMALTTLITIALSGIRVLNFSSHGDISADELPAVELTLAMLPLIALSLMFLLLGGAGQRRIYYAVTGLLTVGAVGGMGAALTIAFFAPVPHLWTMQLYACYGMFVGGYLVIARQCGARLVWRQQVPKEMGTA